ncbi:tumor necrosis factor receptor superfamily member 12A [Microcaecilia unicolor]|uniref:Tumor necrosis factor receptor superfamily member 12A n=1 Tax=Microcaecilia unicolor TaxID=1415580 RepID=A0A6P7YBU1_9AMPH|nr:tumor necrosis factor receptor superfamily member 12A [Microcaecilia unicolor]
MLLAQGLPLPLLVLLLLGLAGAEQAAESACQNGKSWSSDLGKCMDCFSCKKSPKGDFCQTCDDVIAKKNDPMWLIVGGTATIFVMLCVIIGLVIFFTQCRKREKFTTPIEETGGHSAEESLIH